MANDFLFIFELESVAQNGIFGKGFKGRGVAVSLFGAEAWDLTETQCAVQYVAGPMISWGQEFLGRSLRRESPFNGRRNGERGEAPFDGRGNSEREEGNDGQQKLHDVEASCK
ncbi:MAG: hypothetical protein Q9228_002979 [Teloschistes exilis]